MTVSANQWELGSTEEQPFRSGVSALVGADHLGGGEGMLLKPEPLFAAVETIFPERAAGARDPSRRVILLSAQGRKFDQAAARRLSEAAELLLICRPPGIYDEIKPTRNLRPGSSKNFSDPSLNSISIVGFPEFARCSETETAVAEAVRPRK